MLWTNPTADDSPSRPTGPSPASRAAFAAMVYYTPAPSIRPAWPATPAWAAASSFYNAASCPYSLGTKIMSPCCSIRYEVSYFLCFLQLCSFLYKYALRSIILFRNSTSMSWVLLGGIQQLRGPILTQLWPPPPLEWTSVDILQPAPSMMF